VTEELTDIAIETARDSGCEPVPGLLENACATPIADFGSDPDEELSCLARLSAENPELRQAIRECESLSQALIAHSQISARTTSQMLDQADAIGRRSGPKFLCCGDPDWIRTSDREISNWRIPGGAGLNRSRSRRVL
jgi:hypothetical protein